MIVHQTPGVYRQDVFPARPAALPTGVPAFLGFAAKGPVAAPRRLVPSTSFEETFGEPLAGSWLSLGVAGFFANGGRECFVVRQASASPESLEEALDSLDAFEDIDLVCAPDLFRAYDPEQENAFLDLQLAILQHCEASGSRFALLDALPGASEDALRRQRRRLESPNGALYHPWLRVQPESLLVPPCGHVAGVVARSDRQTGVHKAPANEVLEGVVDVELDLTDRDQAGLNPIGINALRSFPGRGIRVWGARTLSNQNEWTYVNVRRLFLTVGRWMERNLRDVAFEPNAPRLWNRISRELTTYLEGLLRAGALQGRVPGEAFYVKCDAEINPPESRDSGRVVTEIGLAPTVPNEFIVVRIVHGAAGVELTGPVA